MRSLMTSGVLLAAMTLGAAPLVWCAPAVADEKAKAAEATVATDELILRSGKVVQGVVIEETASEVKFKIIMKGMPAAVATYPKSDILELKRDAITPVGEGETSEDAAATDEIDDSGIAVELADLAESTARIYHVKFGGLFGTDVSQTPLAKVFKDVDKVFGDIDPSSGKVRPDVRDRNIVVIEMDTTTDVRMGFDGIWRVEGLAPIIEEQIKLKNRRVVFWVKDALNGAAFVPFSSPEIYFHSEGRMGFTSDLEEFSLGDVNVDEKQISLRIGHARGFLNEGGYPADLVEAMCRSSNVLYVRIIGGVAEFLTHAPRPDDGGGWELLTDDGKGENDDKFSFKGNDLLVLEADWAYKLGVSDGTADSLEDLMFMLGVGTDHHVFTEKQSRGSRILEAWSTKIDEVYRMVNTRPSQQMPLGRLWREFQEIRVEGTYERRQMRRGQQIQLLMRIRSLFKQYAEVLDPSGGMIAEIDLQIEAIRKQADADRLANKGGATPGGGTPGGGSPGSGRPGTRP